MTLGHPGIALDKRAHVVAEAAIPLFPLLTDKAAHLVEPSSIPCLGDQLCAGQDRVVLDVPQDRRVGQRRALLVAREDGSQVKAKTVDMHLLHPIMQAVDDHAAHHGLVGIERIAGAAVVGVTRLVLLEDVIDLVVEAAKA